MVPLVPLVPREQLEQLGLLVPQEARVQLA